MPHEKKQIAGRENTEKNNPAGEAVAMEWKVR